MMKNVLALDPANYRRHLIHGENRLWAETNCYVDVWVELLHAWGFEPVAALPFTVAIDFEGDQWTFFKYPLHDLNQLFGLDVQELALWRPLVRHLDEQIGQGRPVLVELDSYFLPDTAGTAYRREHVKSTVAAVAMDTERQTLGYFHGQGYYHLQGDDFVQVLRLNEQTDSAVLPPYAEFVKRRSCPQSSRDVAQISLELLKHHLRMAPETNPFVRFKSRLQEDRAWLGTESLETFHRYSFATLRQFGACFELTATYMHWLHNQLDLPVGEVAAAYSQMSMTAKVLQFNLARSMARKKPLDPGPLDQLADGWQKAVGDLQSLLL